MSEEDLEVLITLDDPEIPKKSWMGDELVRRSVLRYHGPVTTYVSNVAGWLTRIAYLGTTTRKDSWCERSAADRTRPK